MNQDRKSGANANAIDGRQIQEKSLLGSAHSNQHGEMRVRPVSVQELNETDDD